jgi:hypothetical protein
LNRRVRRRGRGGEEREEGKKINRLLVNSRAGEGKGELKRIDGRELEVVLKERGHADFWFCCCLYFVSSFAIARE